MTRKTKLSAYAPFIALGLVAIGYLAAQHWFFPPEETEGTAEDRAAPAAESEPPTEVSIPAPKAVAVESWPLYHGGYELNGNAQVTLPEAPVRRWQYLGEGPIRQPAVCDGRAIYAATLTGTVISLDFSGNERWSRQLSRNVQGAGAPERLEAPIACIRSTVLIGSKSGIIHALDSETGAERWTYDVGGEVLGTVTAYETEQEDEPIRLFAIERSEGVLHSFDFETGRGLWRTNPINRTDGSAVTGNGMVVFGSCAAAIHVYSVYDGRLMRSVDLCGDCQVAAGIALVGDEVFAGCRSGRLYRVNAKVGSVVWMNQDAAKDVFTTPAICGDTAVFGCEGGVIYAVDTSTGKLTWKHETKGNPASPVCAGDRVVVASGGVLYVHDLATGQVLWSYEAGDAITGPSIIAGMIVVGGEDGAITAFGGAPEAEQAS